MNIFTALNGLSFNFYLLLLQPAGVVSCGGPKKSPRTSPIVQMIFFFWSFEIKRTDFSMVKQSLRN